MSMPVRLGLFYAAIFIGNGASSPYMPVWFHHRGLSGAQIGLILSAPLLARAVTAPAIAVWADSFKLRRTPLVLLALVTAAAYALLTPNLGFVWWFAIWFVANSLYATLPPLHDVIVLNRSRTDDFNYGWPRGMGSAAFIIGNVGMGAILARWSPELVLVWMVMAVLATALGGRFLIPPDPVLASGAKAQLSDRLGGLKELIGDKDFMLAVSSVGLIQSAHAFYYGFSALAWKQQGIPESLTGVLWGVGVAVEVGFLWFLEPWRRKVGPRNLLVMGGAASVIRWTTLAFSPPLWLTFPVQALHTFTYAATFVASLEIVERLSSRTNASAAQLMNSALSGGMLMGLATMGSGALFDGWGAKGYLVMSVMSLAGLAGAVRLYGVKRLDG
ncbi:MFS transporter [Phenylobacterium aquaticum]|nr:MFS transporter [Phenylobacterium aquaticum]MCI3134114.1 MFS transporter [Phenylobacterium aquaticum]